MNQDSILRSLVADNLVSDPAGARGRLLHEAAKLFRDKGYERTTVRDLAAAVGIQSGSLFHHFRTKEEILKAVMVETIRLNTALMQAAVDMAAGGGAPPMTAEECLYVLKLVSGLYTSARDGVAVTVSSSVIGL